MDADPAATVACQAGQMAEVFAVIPVRPGKWMRGLRSCRWLALSVRPAALARRVLVRAEVAAQQDVAL